MVQRELENEVYWRTVVLPKWRKAQLLGSIWTHTQKKRKIKKSECRHAKGSRVLLTVPEDGQKNTLKDHQWLQFHLLSS